MYSLANPEQGPRSHVSLWLCVWTGLGALALIYPIFGLLGYLPLGRWVFWVAGVLFLAGETFSIAIKHRIRWWLGRVFNGFLPVILVAPLMFVSLFVVGMLGAYAELLASAAVAIALDHRREWDRTSLEDEGLQRALGTLTAYVIFELLLVRAANLPV